LTAEASCSAAVSASGLAAGCAAGSRCLPVGCSLLWIGLMVSMQL